MIDKINNDLKEAMKTQEKFTLSVLRMLKSAIIYESRLGENHELSDNEVIATIKRQIKSRKANIEEYSKYNRQDLVTELEKEVEVLQKYLPTEISDSELNLIIDEVFTELKPTSMKDFGSVIKAVALKVDNRADMGKVSQIIKSKMN